MGGGVNPHPTPNNHNGGGECALAATVDYNGYQATNTSWPEKELNAS